MSVSRLEKSTSTFARQVVGVEPGADDGGAQLVGERAGEGVGGDDVGEAGRRPPWSLYSASGATLSAAAMKRVPM
jgi:hypothetical protein